MGSRRPISAILAVFGGLEIGLRCARYAGWVCIRCIYDLRRPPGYSLSPQKSVKRIFCRQKVGRSRFRVRHDAGVFRPNGRHQRNANGEKTLKPRSFGFWGGRTEKVEAKKPNRKSAKCAICRLSPVRGIGQPGLASPAEGRVCAAACSVARSQRPDTSFRCTHSRVRPPWPPAAHRPD